MAQEERDSLGDLENCIYKLMALTFKLIAHTKRSFGSLARTTQTQLELKNKLGLPSRRILCNLAQREARNSFFFNSLFTFSNAEIFLVQTFFLIFV